MFMEALAARRADVGPKVHEHVAEHADGEEWAVRRGRRGGGKLRQYTKREDLQRRRHARAARYLGARAPRKTLSGRARGVETSDVSAAGTLPGTLG